MRRTLLLTLVLLLVAGAVAAPLVVAFRGDEPSATLVVVAPGRDSFAIVSRSLAGAAPAAALAPSETRVHWVRTTSFPWIERESFQRAFLRDATPDSSFDLGETTLHVPPADHLRVAFVGDTGAEADADRVLARVAAQKPDLVVHVGDVAYAFGDERLWDGWMALAARDLPGVPVAYVTGNHDTDTALDREEMDGLRGGATYYSFDAGPVHFAVLDSNAVSDAQARWLDQDLAAAQAAGAKWIVPVEHHPWYSSGTTHGSLVAAQETFSPILEKHGVRLAVSGHEHNYERTSPLGGVTYVVTGGGGGALYDDFQSPPPAWSAARHAGHELLLVDFTPGGAQAKAISPEGATIDAFSL